MEKMNANNSTLRLEIVCKGKSASDPSNPDEEWSRNSDHLIKTNSHVYNTVNV